MTLVFALLVTQGVHLVRGEAAEAMAIGDEVVALCSEYGLPQEREWSRSFQGAALAALGRLDEGHRTAHRQPRGAAGDWRRSGAQRVSRASWRICCASPAASTMGCAPSSEGFAHAEQYGEGGYLAELHRGEGGTAAARGATTRARKPASLRPSSTRAGSRPARSSCAPRPAGRSC